MNEFTGQNCPLIEDGFEKVGDALVEADAGSAVPGKDDDAIDLDEGEVVQIGTAQSADRCTDRRP